MSGTVQLDCVRVPLSSANSAIRSLKREGLLSGAKPRREGEYLLIPVVSAHGALKILEGQGIISEPCRGLFEAVQRRGPLPKELGVSGFVKVGSVVIFSQARSVPFEVYVRAAELVATAYKDVDSVFLKVGTVGELRLPQLVLLYGSGSTLTRVKENGLTFLVDVARAYYNPRLAEERLRVASQIADGEQVLDMFAGVGPFSITAASHSACNVLAVDVNPYAVQLLANNIEINRRRLKGSVVPLRADSSKLADLIEGEFDHIIMNNPTAVLNFIDVACLLATRGAKLHIYILAHDEQSAAEAVIKAAVRSCGRAELVSSRRALEYSPSKTIYSVNVVVRP